MPDIVADNRSFELVYQLVSKELRRIKHVYRVYEQIECPIFENRVERFNREYDKEAKEKIDKELSGL